MRKLPCFMELMHYNFTEKISAHTIEPWFLAREVSHEEGFNYFSDCAGM
jgi:hypothetical protein